MVSSGTVLSFLYLILIRGGEHVALLNALPPALSNLVLVLPYQVCGLMSLFIIHSPDVSVLCKVRYPGYCMEEVMFSAFREVPGQ